MLLPCLTLALTYHLSTSSLAETRATFPPASRRGSQATIDHVQPLGCCLYFSFTWLLTSRSGEDPQTSVELASFFILHQDPEREGGDFSDASPALANWSFLWECRCPEERAVSKPGGTHPCGQAD